MSSDNFRPFAWNTQRITAAELIADGELTDLQIAEQVGISDRQMRTWKHHPDFQAKVAEYTQLLEAGVLKLAIAQRRKRVSSQNDRWRKMLAVIEERAHDPAMQAVPGGKTGLLVHRERAIGTGRNQTIIDEYEVDTGLLKALLEHEKHAAQELGQWADKHEHGGIPGAPLKVEHDFDIDAYRATFQALLGVSDAEPGTADADSPDQ